MRFLLLVRIGLFVLPTAASASNWVIFDGSSKVKFYADMESLAPVSDGVAKVQVKLEYVSDPTTSPHYSIQQWEFICQTHQVRTTANANYRHDGTTVNSSKFTYAAFDAVRPDSVGQTLESAVCPSSGPSSTVTAAR